MWRLLRCAPVGLIVITLSACAVKAQARTEVELPALDPPPPPPRVIAVYPPEVKPEPAPPVAETPSTPRPVERPARPETAKPEPPKPEIPGPPAPRPSLTITPTPGTEAQTEAAIRTLLAKASRDLSRVNPASLGTDGRAQFDTAKRFLQQAEEALKNKNLVYAGTLADKASTLAAVFAR
jgi:hypothetical protein